MQLKTQEQYFKETFEQKIQLKHTHTHKKTQYILYFKELNVIEMNTQ